MNLLIVVVKDQDYVDDFLSVLVELDVSGLQILDSSSVIELLAQRAPIFAGLRQLVARPKAESKIILGLVQEDDFLSKMDFLLRKVKLNLDQQGIGYAVLVPTIQSIGQLDLDSG